MNKANNAADFDTRIHKPKQIVQGIPVDARDVSGLPVDTEVSFTGSKVLFFDDGDVDTALRLTVDAYLSVDDMRNLRKVLKGLEKRIRARQ